MFSYREHTTIAETFWLYDMTAAQEKAAWICIEKRWRQTSGHFYAYNTAHQIAAAVTR